MTDTTYVPRTSADEDTSHKLDAERTAWESSREHDPGTGSPQAKGEKVKKSSKQTSEPDESTD
jgi:hypothetical protein